MILLITDFRSFRTHFVIQPLSGGYGCRTPVRAVCLARRLPPAMFLARLPQAARHMAARLTPSGRRRAWRLLARWQAWSGGSKQEDEPRAAGLCSSSRVTASASSAARKASHYAPSYLRIENDQYRQLLPRSDPVLQLPRRSVHLSQARAPAATLTGGDVQQGGPTCCRSSTLTVHTGEPKPVLRCVRATSADGFTWQALGGPELRLSKRDVLN